MCSKSNRATRMRGIIKRAARGDVELGFLWVNEKGNKHGGEDLREQQ